MKNYELRIEDNSYFFHTAKEAYLYYLKNFATEEDYEYYRNCANRELEDIADNERLIGMVFENVFNDKHHIYKQYVREDSQICRERLF